MTQQTEVTKAANGSEPAPGAASPGSDLGSLIEEFEKGTANENANLAKVLKTIQPVVNYVAADAEAKFNSQLKDIIKENVSLIRKEAGIPDIIPDKVIEGQLHKQANDDATARAAWAEISNSPEKLKPHIKALVEDIKEWATKIPQQDSTRSDVERAAASVRNVSTQPAAKKEYDPAVLMDMPEREFQKLLGL